jgi:recombination protein RecT
MTAQLTTLQNETDLKLFLQKNYMAQIKNFMGDEKRALKFLSSMMADMQRNPKLKECVPMTVINAYMVMAQLGFMPSGVSGEAYVIPYANNRKVGERYEKVLEAQFQLGYQGLVTLFYQAGVSKISSGIVREKDKVEIVNGLVRHEVDFRLSNSERGAPIGAYAIAVFRGEETSVYMNAKDIIAHAKKFSKSYDETGKYSPWNPENDPELWMWKKTCLKQSKLLPKNEILNKAIALDNEDSTISDIKNKELLESDSLRMGKFLKNEKENKETSKEETGAVQTTDSNESQEAGE